MLIRYATKLQREIAAQEAGRHVDATFEKLVRESPHLWVLVPSEAEKHNVLGAAGLKIKGIRADLTIAFVHPWYRGHGHQARLIDARLTYARKHGAQTAYTYCSRTNSPSLVSLLKQGFVVSGFDGQFVYVRRWLIAH